MKSRRIRPLGPVVLTGSRPPNRRRAATREEVLGKAALETPLPGQLLVLLSRLHRAKDGPASGDKP